MIQYMPLFRSCSTTRTLVQVHAHLVTTGQYRSHLASTKLIESYAQMGSIDCAKLVFQTFPAPDSFMYGVLIKRYVWNGLFKEAVALYCNMLHELTLISRFIFPSVLRACSSFGDLGLGQNVHGRIIKCGFESDSIVQTSLLNMYGEASCLSYARRVFDEMPERDVVSWSSVISMHVRNGQPSQGLKLFLKMVIDGHEPDYVTLLSIAEACGELGLGLQSKSIHSYAVTRKIENSDHGLLNNSLIAMYGKCGDLHNAQSLFDRVSSHCTSSWTSMITCYNHNGFYQTALDLFKKMQESKTEGNAITMMAILCSCARLSYLREGQSIHGFIVRKQLDADYILGPALIDLYANCGKFNTCHKIFDTSRNRNVISWNMLVSGYTREGMSEDALDLFKQMRAHTISPDEFTIASVVSACGNIGFSNLGTQVHGYVTKTGILNEFVQNSLIDMYAKCGFIDSAYSVFKNQNHRSVVGWNSMMWGFYHNGNSVDAMNLFDQMYLEGQEMDDVTFLSAIQACSNLRYLEKGKWIHHKLITNGVMNDNTFVNTALLDMYAKCGDLRMAQTIFEIISDKSVVSWSAMIDAYGMHGLVDLAISIFNRMMESNMKPNEITFMNILSACSHAGYVEEGKFYFDSMRKDFGIEPKLEHFSCLIDLLSRAGHLDDAYRIIGSMPFEIGYDEADSRKS
ncbi:putative pentatricopeptide repeat-containing protein At1g69350, mitochondrial [Cynara cardunculus var. scolymus]|uniref:putative pentatricopeptide repeat-containing protein At1g69350, mitochondrial n=1 Tax=Cynara cardunculus var. scolymus TaxID=59895 RepID=UPI000D625D6E|nr:putative pentatricopeptide repeat-containing protein At1g69350, mitochondrial [Cynara cardunculus var. scolymus]